jgi:N-acyl-D-aspartate/D-glutamate deacylase
MLCDPLSALGGSDAGAHVRVICDASIPTSMLTAWSRDRAKNDPYHLPLEFVVKKLSSDGAGLYSLADRGMIASGMKTDLNLIDYNALERPGNGQRPAGRDATADAKGARLHRDFRQR